MWLQGSQRYPSLTDVEHVDVRERVEALRGQNVSVREKKVVLLNVHPRFHLNVAINASLGDNSITKQTENTTQFL